MKTAAEIQEWLLGQIAAILGVPEDDIDPGGTFDSFGLASRDAVSLSGDLEDYLNRRLSPTLLYQYPTIRELTAYLAEEPAVHPSASQMEMPKRSADLPALSERAVAEMSGEEAETALLKKLLELDE